MLSASNVKETPMENRSTSPTGQGGLVETVKQRATAQLDSQKERATDGLTAVAQAVRTTTQQLRNEHHDVVAQYVERAADQIERFSNALRQKHLNELVDDAQRLARRQPALFIGGSFALGLLAARFLKSSRHNGHDQWASSGDMAGYGTNTYRPGAVGTDAVAGERR
jgi:hypothetical protein